MRILADMLKDTTPQNSLILVELLAAQVVASAAYEGRKFNSVSEVEVEVLRVAGYPMLNRMSPGKGPLQPNVGTETARRVCAIIGLRFE